METKNRWIQAITNGFLLSLITIVAMAASSALQTAEFGGKSILSIIIWAIKFGGSIYLLYYFMKSYRDSQEQVSYKEAFGNGTMICIFSSIIISLFTYLQYTVISPELTEVLIQSMNQVAEKAGGESMNSLLPLIDNIVPTIVITMLVYLTIFGVITASIIANYTKKDDIFFENE